MRARRAALTNQFSVMDHQTNRKNEMDMSESLECTDCFSKGLRTVDGARHETSEETRNGLRYTTECETRQDNRDKTRHARHDTTHDDVRRFFFPRGDDARHDTRLDRGYETQSASSHKTQRNAHDKRHGTGDPCHRWHVCDEAIPRSQSRRK